MGCGGAAPTEVRRERATDALLERVRKLLAKAEKTDNPHEAEAFATKAAELIALHRIAPERLRPTRDGRPELRRVPLGRGAYVRARLALLGAVAQAHDAQVVFQIRLRGHDRDPGWVPGRPRHRRGPLPLVARSGRAQMADSVVVRPAATQRWRRAFLFGYAARVGELLGRRPPGRRARGRRRRHGVARSAGARRGGRPVRRRRVRSGRRRLAVGAGGGGGMAGRPSRRRRRRHRPDPAVVPAGDRARSTVTLLADIGRTALGEAEAAAFGGTDLEAEREIAELRAGPAAVTGGSWWRAAGGPPVTVTAARASARSSRAAATGAARWTGALAAGQRDVATLAHELAHALAGVGHGHDERFRAALVDVVTVVAGAPAATALTDALAALRPRRGRPHRGRRPRAPKGRASSCSGGESPSRGTARRGRGARVEQRPVACAPMTVEPPRLETTFALVLAGEIDSYTAPELADLLAKHPDVDAVDLRDVTFIDSSGLRVIVEAHQRRLEEERVLVLRSPSPAVQRLLEISGVAGTSPWPSDRRLAAGLVLVLALARRRAVVDGGRGLLRPDHSSLTTDAKPKRGSRRIRCMSSSAALRSASVGSASVVTERGHKRL